MTSTTNHASSWYHFLNVRPTAPTIRAAHCHAPVSAWRIFVRHRRYLGPLCGLRILGHLHARRRLSLAQIFTRIVARLPIHNRTFSSITRAHVICTQWSGIFPLQLSTMNAVRDNKSYACVHSLENKRRDGFYARIVHHLRKRFKRFLSLTA